MCISPSVHPSHFYINLYVLVIYEDVLTKFARNVYCYENISVKIFGLILNNKMAAISDFSKNSLTCSKSLNIEASFIKFAQNVYGHESPPHSNDDLILTTKWPPYHMLKVKGGS